jgi:hypothetical protein
MGCLLAPVRLIGCLGLLVVLAVGWLYRDRITDAAKRVVSGGDTSAAAGRPGAHALAEARAKADSLGRARVDSVVLTPAQTASLLGQGIDPAVRGQLDSMTVRLQEGRIAVSALLSTARLPRELLGPLALVVHDREPVTAAGPITVSGPGRATWRIERLSVRGFPVPTDALDEIFRRATGRAGGRSVPVKLPPAVREIHIRPTGAVLIGARAS